MTLSPEFIALMGVAVVIGMTIGAIVAFASSPSRGAHVDDRLLAFSKTATECLDLAQEYEAMARALSVAIRRDLDVFDRCRAEKSIPRSAASSQGA